MTFMFFFVKKSLTYSKEDNYNGELCPGTVREGHARPMTLGQKLDCAKACGFDYMELSVDETDDKLARLA